MCERRFGPGPGPNPGPTQALWCPLRLTLLGKLRRLVLWLLLVYVSVPFIIKLCPSIQAKLVFLNFGEFKQLKSEKRLQN